MQVFFARCRSSLCSLLVVVAATLAFFVSLGSSSSQASPAPITLRVLAPVGTVNANYPGALSGARAAAYWINKHGGVKGHKLSITFCNTQWVPAASAACAQGVVTDKVAAVVGNPSTAVDTQVLPDLQQAQIPDIGILSTGSPAEYTNPASWPIEGGTFGSYLAIPFGAAESHVKHLVFAVVNIPSTLAIYNDTVEAAKAAHLNIAISDVPIPLSGVTDFSPYAQQIKNAGADGVAFILPPGDIPALITATRTLGVHPKLFDNAFSFNEQAAAAAGVSTVKGMIVPSPFPSWRESKTSPGIALFDAQMKASHHQGNRSLYGDDAINAWLAVYAFAAVAEHVKGPINHTSVWNELPKVHTVQLGGGLLAWNPSSIAKTPASAFLQRLPNSPFGFLQLNAKGQILSTKLKPATPMTAIRH